MDIKVAILHSSLSKVVEKEDIRWEFEQEIEGELIFIEENPDLVEEFRALFEKDFCFREALKLYQHFGPRRHYE
jgi:hypothetical protein